MLLRKQGRNKWKSGVCPLEALSENHDWARQVTPISSIAWGLNFNEELRFG